MSINSLLNVCKDNVDLGKLLVRITVAVMMLPHGITKLPFFWGLSQASGTLVKSGLPGSLAFTAYIGEIIGPLLILIGYKAKFGAVLVIITMVFAIILTSGTSLFGLDAYGGFKGEKQLLYIVASFAIIYLGSGKYSLEK
ncbi:MAG: DoxX family protein [Campylobacteraceae bacterium]